MRLEKLCNILSVLHCIERYTLSQREKGFPLYPSKVKLEGILFLYMKRIRKEK